ncbi:hypothetical protein CLPU_25c00030 [Gottschalkia purinilytica]|uniref:YkuS family protein n=1 Tax=Gottschalkia purinilytica TaxID=1503 RepID=A0A0L0W6D6_GOTPU|nr:YkuS family protein [Gottschalkia purinilytica]KNF07093.1 hypothetical protein CLPU_25c00030 [Gottschalkia purinilytica]
MSMKIVVQDGLDEIRTDLHNLGYEIVDIDSGENIEAVIYMADGQDISYYSNIISMSNSQEDTGNKGTLLINAKGKNTQEINKIITNRSYSPIFD